MAVYSKPRGLLPLLFTFVLFLQATVAIQHGHHHHHHNVPRTPEAMAGHLQDIGHLLEEGMHNLFGAASNQGANQGGSNKGASNQGGSIAITGIQGTVAQRLEIRDLAKNTDQWNLYLLGMERFMAKAKTDPLSFYQVAGVHGRPYVTWNNFPTPLLNNAGFCPHAQTMFASWHRPYLGIYEQAWYQCVQEVVATFPANQQQRWRSAAATLRMPFWDWARFPGAGQPAVPTQIRDQQVTVTKPSGQVTIANPLYSYSFGSSLPVEMNGGPWNNWPATLRRPVANPTRSNNNEMNNKFQSIRINLRDRLFGLFSTRASFGLVSTSALGARTAQNGNNPDSIESIHDVVHSTIGGESGGHMWYLDLSAFDPIFWLHHTNIDRLLAMYQVITPDTWVATGKVSRNMAQWNAGETKDADSPLKPFTKNAKGDYYTSNDIKNTRVLGYVYPETNGNPNANSMMASVNSLYGPGSPSKKRDTNGQYEGRPFREGDYNTVLSVIGNKYAVEGSYTVHCFLGQPSSNSTANSTAPFPLGNSTTPDMPISSSTPSNSTSPYSNSTETYDFTQNPNYVGVYAIAGGSMGGPDAQKVMTEGSLPLTTALQGKEASGELKSLHPDDVEEYLKHNLHYKVIVTGNIEVPADSIPDLHISVKSCKVTPAASPDQLPVYSGNYAVLPKATEGKPAGQPFVYTPTPAEVIIPGKGEPGHTTETTPANGTMVFPAPDAEPGYCVSKQVVMYVDPNGHFLYQEES